MSNKNGLFAKTLKNKDYLRELIFEELVLSFGTEEVNGFLVPEQ